MQQWYQSVYMNNLIHGILLSKMVGYSIQIYSLQCFSHLYLNRYLSAKASNTNVYICGIPGIYWSKYQPSTIVQWLDGFGVGLVLCQKQQALG